MWTASVALAWMLFGGLITSRVTTSSRIAAGIFLFFLVIWVAVEIGWLGGKNRT